MHTQTRRAEQKKIREDAALGAMVLTLKQEKEKDEMRDKIPPVYYMVPILYARKRRSEQEAHSLISPNLIFWSNLDHGHTHKLYVR